MPSLLSYSEKKGGDYMKGGFSFCNIDIEDVGLNYAPENNDTYVYRPGASNVHEETFEGHDGGYVYGASREPKEFILRCYYEDTHVAKGLMSRAHALFKVGKTGLLVFKRRPWCYYYATVTNVNTDDMYSYLNGLFVITMKAYYPFARGLEINGHMFYNLPTDSYHDEIMANTGIFDKDFLVPQMSFNTTPITQQKSIILYNPGTERAKVNIVIAGNAGDGVTIANKTTEQMCRYVAFNTSGDEYVYTDAINGKTVFDNGSERRLAFLYHDYGFIELEPSFPIVRNIFASYDGNTVTTTNTLYNKDRDAQVEDQIILGEPYNSLPYKEWYIGKYIYLDNWYKILRCEDEHTITIQPRDGQLPTTGTVQTNIVLMNEITITPTQGASLSKLSFIYKPTYS